MHFFIKRYPNGTNSYISTTVDSFTGETAPKRESIKPNKAQLELYIHPYETVKNSELPSFEQKRYLSTVSRRTYVPPEVMKYKS
jgi:hypothetical protein